MEAPTQSRGTVSPRPVDPRLAAKQLRARMSVPYSINEIAEFLEKVDEPTMWWDPEYSESPEEDPGEYANNADLKPGDTFRLWAAKKLPDAFYTVTDAGVRDATPDEIADLKKREAEEAARRRAEFAARNGVSTPNTFEQYEARRHTGPCHGHPSDSYRHDAENDGLPLTTGGQYDEIGWLLARGLLIVAGVAIGVALYKVAF